MKRAVEGERDRADRPVGAVDVKLAVHGDKVRVDVSCRTAGGGIPPGCLRILEDLSASRSRLAGCRAPSRRATHRPRALPDPAFPMALSLAELLPGDQPRTPVGHVPYGRGALGDPDVRSPWPSRKLLARELVKVSSSPLPQRP